MKVNVSNERSNVNRDDFMLILLISSAAAHSTAVGDGEQVGREKAWSSCQRGREWLKKAERSRKCREDWAIWQAIKRSQSMGKDERGRKNFPLYSFVLSSCPLHSSPFSSPLSLPCSLSSDLPAHYKNSVIMLQSWAAEQITFSKGESGERTSREAGKRFPLSHRRRKKEREIARGMKGYCSLVGNNCNGGARNDSMEGERERRVAIILPRLCRKSR